jgi:hypothetical protein
LPDPRLGRAHFAERVRLERAPQLLQLPIDRFEAARTVTGQPSGHADTYELLIATSRPIPGVGLRLCVEQRFGAQQRCRHAQPLQRLLAGGCG